MRYAKRDGFWGGDKQKQAMAAHAERQVKRVEVAKGVYKFFEGKFREVGKNLFWTVEEISGGVEKAKVTE